MSQVELSTSQEDTSRIANHFELKPKTWLKRDAKRHLNGKYILKSNKDDGICIFLNSKKQCRNIQCSPPAMRSIPWWAENLRSEKSGLRPNHHVPALMRRPALLIEHGEIKFHVQKDIISSKGFRVW